MPAVDVYARTSQKSAIIFLSLENVIAVCEMWLDSEKISDVEPEGYELFSTYRLCKKEELPFMLIQL